MTYNMLIYKKTFRFIFTILCIVSQIHPLPEIDETVYCSSKYSYDVSELYVHCKDILSKYGFSISKFNSNNLFTFLFNYLYVIDDNDTEEEEELDFIDEY